MVDEGEQEGQKEKEEGGIDHHLAFAQLPPASNHPGTGGGEGVSHKFSVFPPHSFPANSELASIPANSPLSSLLTKGLPPLFLPPQLRSLRREGPFSQHPVRVLPSGSSQPHLKLAQSPLLPGYSVRQREARVGKDFSGAWTVKLQRQESRWPGERNAENKVPFRPQRHNRPLSSFLVQAKSC